MLHLIVRGWPNRVLDVHNLLTSQKERKKLIITECNVVQVITHKTILFLSANCVLDGRMFGKGASLPDTAETYSWKDVCPVMYNDYHQVESFQLSFQKLSKCCRDPSSSRSTVHNRHKEFQFHRMMSEDSDRSGCPMTVTSRQNRGKVKCPVKEDRPTNDFWHNQCGLVPWSHGLKGWPSVCMLNGGT